MSVLVAMTFILVLIDTFIAVVLLAYTYDIWERTKDE